MNNIKKLQNLLGNKVKDSEPLKNYTFLKIGGPADLLIEATSVKELINAVEKARETKVPVTILGDGSNVLITDKGIRGLVIINKAGQIEVFEKDSKKTHKIMPTARWESDRTRGTFKYEFKDLDYSEENKPRVKVRMDSGVSLPFALDVLLDKGITGLQWYAGIPGTIGGAVFNNIHGGTHFLSEVLNSVKVINDKGRLVEYSINNLGVDYDKSRFQETKEVIIDATFNLFKGDVGKARYVRNEWAKRKSIQPRNSPGCAFHNLTQEQKKKLNLPTTSAGFVIEHLLKMSGYRKGDAAISEKHHNFIVNEGNAKASDYLDIMKNIYWKAKKDFNITLVPEIFLLGFDEGEIKEFLKADQVKLRKQRVKEIKTIYKDSKKLFKK